jgi:hypothetical protein
MDGWVAGFLVVLVVVVVQSTSAYHAIASTHSRTYKASMQTCPRRECALTIRLSSHAHCCGAGVSHQHVLTWEIQSDGRQRNSNDP